MLATQQQKQQQHAKATTTTTKIPTPAATTTTESDIQKIKMERRDSTTSESSVEQLDLGRTPKKLSAHSATTSTPHSKNNNNSNTNKIAPTTTITTNGGLDILTTTTTITTTTGKATTRKRKLRCTRDTEEDDEEDDDIDGEIDHDHNHNDNDNDDGVEEELDENLVKIKTEDEDHNNDDDVNDAADGDNNDNSPAVRKHQRTHKRRRASSNPHRLDKRSGANAIVQLITDSESGNSLRKKFRFNRSNLDQQQQQQQISNNESGFVDASGNGSQYSLNANVSVASSSGGSSPHGVSSPESLSGAEHQHQHHHLHHQPHNEHMKFVCPICEVVSATPHEFTNHIRSHNYSSGDTENFTCKICSKVLSSASSLDRHVLVHTGERPFNCKYCHLTFTTNGNMHRHMRTHKQHQQNHHHRRNSNGTKNNGGGGSAATQTSTTSAAAAAATPNAFTSTSASSSRGGAGGNEGVNKQQTLMVNGGGVGGGFVGGGNGGKRRLNGSSGGSGSVGNIESYESDDGSCSMDSTSANSQSSSSNNNNNNNNNDNNLNNNNNSSHHHHHHNNNNNNNNNNLKSNNNLKRKKRDSRDRQLNVVDDNNTNNTKAPTTTEIGNDNESAAHATGADDDNDDDDDATTLVSSGDNDKLVLVTTVGTTKHRRVKTTINNNIIETEAEAEEEATNNNNHDNDDDVDDINNHDGDDEVNEIDANTMEREDDDNGNGNADIEADIITSTPDVATVAVGAEPEELTTIRKVNSAEYQVDPTLCCPVCKLVDFICLRDLGIHMDHSHPNIPTKCRRCKVVFRTHRQLHTHPCTKKLKNTLKALEKLKKLEKRSSSPIDSRTSANQPNFSANFHDHNHDDDVDEDTTDFESADGNSDNEDDDDTDVHYQNDHQIEVSHLNVNQHNRENVPQHHDDDDDDIEGNAGNNDNEADDSDDRPMVSTDLQRREELLRQLYLKNNKTAVSMLSPIYNDEPSDNTSSLLKYEVADTKQSHDSKDLADIQSILNMTSSSSTSNFLKNFEQSVNTPSSNYSCDKDEEEAQDAFTSEFRKMKLRGEFPCKLCTAVFPNLRALKGHNRIHLSAVGPAGPFRCNMCPYSICDKAALVRHMRTHNGDRPYECAVCNYAFTTKANCERHLRNRHAKTTRDEVKRAIIYHPSEDSSCDDPVKKLHLFNGSSDFDDDIEMTSTAAATGSGGSGSGTFQSLYHHPKDRSTPVSHLKEMLLADHHHHSHHGHGLAHAHAQAANNKPLKIQVKSLEQLLDKSNSSIYNEPSQTTTTANNLNQALAPTDHPSPIDLSMDALDLSKKPNGERTRGLPQTTNEPELISLGGAIGIGAAEPKFDFSMLEKNQQLLLAQQQLLNEAFPKALVDPAQYFQQLYRNLVFQPLNPFFLQNSFMPNQLNDLQKFAPLMSRMFGNAAACNGSAASGAVTSSSINVNDVMNKHNATNSPTTLLPQISPLMSSDKSSTQSSPNPVAAQLLPKSMRSSPSAAPSTANSGGAPLNIPRHPHHQHHSHHHNIPPTVLSGGPVKMVIKNGVLMPKQKQRRYRTERPFACEHCSARFTLRSNMERHVKQQHPQYYAQRQRSGHHVMRGRGASSNAAAAAMNSFNHLQAFAQAQSGAHHGHLAPSKSGIGTTASSPISEQVKYAILAQQLKARKDTDLLQQALAHGSSSIAANHLLLGNGGGGGAAAAAAATVGGPMTNNIGQGQFSFVAHMNHSNQNSNNETNANGAMEDDEPKLIIDEDDEHDDEDDDDDDGDHDDNNDHDKNANDNNDNVEQIDDDIEVIPDDDDDNDADKNHDDAIANKNDRSHHEEEEIKDAATPIAAISLPIKPMEIKLSAYKSKEKHESAKRMAETILEQAIKAGLSTKPTSTKSTPTPIKQMNKLNEDPKPAIPTPTPTSTSHASGGTKAQAMKSMIAQAGSVGKFLKEVASSPFKDESQDLVPVSKLVDNATSNQMSSFNTYFRPSDVANHMEQSDEEGLVASGSASESNNSGTEDVTAPVEPKKKSAYSLAPNRVSCPYCQRMFPWSSSLRRHILTHTGQKPFKCSHCPLLFTTKSNCDRHLLRKHGNVESAMSVYVPTEDVTEPIPVPKSVEEIEQQQRQREEEERRRKAEEAQLERERREQERRQQREQEQQEQLLKQIAAAAQFNQLSAAAAVAAAAVNAAAAAANSGNKVGPIANETNGANSSSAPAAGSTSEAAASSDLPYKCHLCESSFGERIQCLEHIKNQHAQEFALLLAKGAIETDVEPQPLHAAPTTIATDEDERERERDANAGKSSSSSSGKYPDYSNRKVICAFCVRRFWSTEDLRRHMRTHSGERPFQCEICLRKFTLKHSMLRHMKKHNGRQYNGINGLNCGNGGVGSGNGSGASIGDHGAAGNSGSDFSDDEQMAATPPPPSLMPPSSSSSSASSSSSSTVVSGKSTISNANVNAVAAMSNALGAMHAPKIQELLSKASEWRSSRLGEHKENIASTLPDNEQHHHNHHQYGNNNNNNNSNNNNNNAQQSGDLIGNLLGISDQGILNKLLSSADEAAKFLGVEK